MENHFEDYGLYYANQDMVNASVVLSVGSGLIYDISESEDVQIIKKITPEFMAIAQKDIDDNGPCFYGQAAVCSYIGQEMGKLTWEL